MQCLQGMQNILKRVWSELWLLVLCLLWRPWYSLQAELCAATSWTRPIGPWPSPPQAALKPHWAGAKMEEIAPGEIDWPNPIIIWTSQWGLNDRAFGGYEKVGRLLGMLFLWGYVSVEGSCIRSHNIDRKHLSSRTVKQIKAQLFVTSFSLNFSCVYCVVKNGQCALFRWDVIMLLMCVF